MQRMPDEWCPLCETLAPCWQADADNAQFFECPNEQCGPSVITDAARKKHLSNRSSKLHRVLSEQALRARCKGMVLRIWEEEGATPDQPRQLRHDFVPIADVQ
jgi:hypothetical protein